MNKKRWLIAMLSVNALLLLIFILSFLSAGNVEKRKSVQTALLNLNKIPDIKSMEFSGDGQSVILEKRGNVWTGTDSASGSLWPADLQTVANFIEKFADVITVYERASSEEDWKKFLLDEKNAFRVCIKNQDGEVISNLFFGMTDSLSQRIYFRAGSGKSVYETQAAMSSFLNASAAFWCDPFVYPQAITGYERTKEESLLRHGQLVEFDSSGLEPYWTFVKRLENGSSCSFNVYKNEEDYTVIPKLIPGPAFSDEDVAALREINYKYNMSQWTFERFLEER